jgi:hypothetical protein
MSTTATGPHLGMAGRIVVDPEDSAQWIASRSGSPTAVGWVLRDKRRLGRAVNGRWHMVAALEEVVWVILGLDSA